MSLPITVTIDLDDETLEALDWHYDAPPGLRIARSEVGSVLRGRLEVGLADLVLKYREAVRKSNR